MSPLVDVSSASGKAARISLRVAASVCVVCSFSLVQSTISLSGLSVEFGSGYRVLLSVTAFLWLLLSFFAVILDVARGQEDSWLWSHVPRTIIYLTILWFASTLLAIGLCVEIYVPIFVCGDNGACTKLDRSVAIEAFVVLPLTIIVWGLMTYFVAKDLRQHPYTKLEGASLPPQPFYDADSSDEEVFRDHRNKGSSHPFSYDRNKESQSFSPPSPDDYQQPRQSTRLPPPSSRPLMANSHFEPFNDSPPPPSQYSFISNVTRPPRDALPWGAEPSWVSDVYLSTGKSKTSRKSSKASPGPDNNSDTKAPSPPKGVSHSSAEPEDDQQKLVHSDTDSGGEGDSGSQSASPEQSQLKMKSSTEGSEGLQQKPPAGDTPTDDSAPTKRSDPRKGGSDKPPFDNELAESDKEEDASPSSHEEIERKRQTSRSRSHSKSSSASSSHGAQSHHHRRRRQHPGSHHHHSHHHHPSNKKHQRAAPPSSKSDSGADTAPPSSSPNDPDNPVKDPKETADVGTASELSENEAEKPKKHKRKSKKSAHAKAPSESDGVEERNKSKRQASSSVLGNVVTSQVSTAMGMGT